MKELLETFLLNILGEYLFSLEKQKNEWSFWQGDITTSGAEVQKIII